MSFLLIIPFIPFLNSSINTHTSYLLLLAVFFKILHEFFYSSSFVSTFLSLATLADLFSLFPNSLFSSAKRFSADLNHIFSIPYFLKNSPSRCLPILPTYMLRSITLVLSLLHLLSIRELALPRLFSFMFFGWSIFHDLFSYLHLSAYLISHALDSFKLHTNTSNCLDISFNSSF